MFDNPRGQLPGTFFSSFFFPCIAGLVRDIVGQQLELVKIEDKFPRKQTKNQQETTNPTTKQHPQKAKPPARQRSREICKLGETGETSAPLSKPLKRSLPPSSIAPRCPCLYVFHINVCTRAPRRVSNIW